MSYLEVLAIQTIVKSMFITSTEIENTPFLGDLCRSAGCLFVNRKSIWNLKNEVTSLEKAFLKGHSVTLFPEGTTTDGTFVLPFRSSLIQAAKNSRVEIVPIAVKFTKINYEPFSIINKDKVCWYSSMAFLPHLFNVCCLRTISLQLNFLPSRIIPLNGCRKKTTRLIQKEIKDVLDKREIKTLEVCQKYYSDRMIWPNLRRV